MDGVNPSCDQYLVFANQSCDIFLMKYFIGRVETKDLPNCERADSVFKNVNNNMAKKLIKFKTIFYTIYKLRKSLAIKGTEENKGKEGLGYC